MEANGHQAVWIWGELHLRPSTCGRPAPRSLGYEAVVQKLPDGQGEDGGPEFEFFKKLFPAFRFPMEEPLIDLRLVRVLNPDIVRLEALDHVGQHRRIMHSQGIEGKEADSKILKIRLSQTYV